MKGYARSYTTRGKALVDFLWISFSVDTEVFKGMKVAGSLPPLTVPVFRKRVYLTPCPVYFFTALCLVTWAAFSVDWGPFWSSCNLFT